MARAPLTSTQRQFLEHVTADRSVADTMTAMQIGRVRYYQLLNALKKHGYVGPGPPPGAEIALTHPQDSVESPWPPPARRVVIAHPTIPGRSFVVRTVLLPREDGLMWPAGLPEEKAVILTAQGDGVERRTHSWTASRHERWPAEQTALRLYRLVAPEEVTPELLDLLTVAIAWAIGVDAVLDGADYLTTNGASA